MKEASKTDGWVDGDVLIAWRLGGQMNHSPGKAMQGESESLTDLILLSAVSVADGDFRPSRMG